MKKYSNLKSVCLAAILGIGTLTGCNKYLNLEPQNSTYDEVFWVNGANVQKALSGSYSMLRDAFRQDRSYFIFGDLAADNFTLGADFWNYTSFLESGRFNFGYAPYLEGTVWNWNRFYSIINQTHLIVENTASIDPSKFVGGTAQQQQLEGEARFLRAYTYFYMQRVWGNVILTTESFKDPQNIPAMPRAEEAEIFEFIIQDLEKAIDLLGNSGNKAVANKGAAQALLAHVYAWKHDYVNAEKYSDEVISSSQASLESLDDYKRIWKGNSKESLFELGMLYSAQSNEASEGFFKVFLTEPYIKNKGLGDAWFLTKPKLDLFFSEQDGRQDAIIEQASGGTDFIVTKYSGVDYYDANNSSTYVVSNSLVLLRLADIYLLRAEARFKNGNESGAREDLNLIRARAEMTPYTGSGQALFEQIFEDRRRELIGEGHTQFDLIRMEQLERLFPNDYTPDRIAKQGYFWPLNMRELLIQDPLLTQNDWWRGN